MSVLNNKKKIGVIGAGKFGKAIIKLLIKNADVLIYVRNKNKNRELIDFFKKDVNNFRVYVTNDINDIHTNCDIIFPILPAISFISIIKQISPFLDCRRHIIIHGIKGFVVNSDINDENIKETKLTRDDIKTISQVIIEETNISKIGCIAGPNLSCEIMEEHPTATVIASKNKLVLEIGQKLLRNEIFQVCVNKDIVGVELCGVLKNIIAIAAGGLRGLNYGENSLGLLISRGIIEMMFIGKFLGASIKPFLGLAGIGDLVATCSSDKSRNYRFGYNLTKNKSIEEIKKEIGETIEGVNTVKVINSLMNSYKLEAPITQTMFKVIYENMPTDDAISFLMNHPSFEDDVDFM